MKIIEIDLEEVKAYENNPRKNEAAVNIVAKSIKECGLNEKIQ